MRRFGYLLAISLSAVGLCFEAAGGPRDEAASLERLPAQKWDRAAAAHLMRRAAFGGSPEEIDRLHALGLEGAVRELVDYERVDYAAAPPSIDPAVTERPDRAALRKLTTAEREKAIEQIRRAQRRSMEEVRLWWLDRIMHSPRPFEEKMTLFWHGHFTSGAREVRNPIFMLEQNQLLRKYAVKNFRDLLIGISKDRAMLTYLDGNRNSKRQPNENYARELMELFTLGVGNYTESDIKAAARAFTGWDYDENGFVFRARNHDDGPKTFLGRKGNFDGGDVIDIILDQPACPRYLARTLLEHFCRPDPDRQLVERLAQVIRKNNYELKPVMMTLFMSEAFYAPSARGSLVKSPIDLLAGTARTFDIGVTDLLALERAAAGMGQELLQPPNVKGWDGGAKWINTATLFARYNFVGGLIFGTPSGGRFDRQRRAAMREMLGDKADGPQPHTAADTTNDEDDLAMAPRSRIAANRQPAYDPRAAIRDRGLATAEQVLDFYCQTLLAAPLSAEKRDLLLQYLNADGVFDPAAPGAANKVRTLIHLICSTPEYQMQ